MTVGVRVLGADEVRTHAAALAAVLIDCVEGGASVGFMATLSPEEARAYFDTVYDGIAAGRRTLLAAFDGEELVGTVQLLVAMLPNATHRGEIAKLLVHRAARRRGIAQALMSRAELEAREMGKTLLVLDTATGSEAERLYEKLGWDRLGSVPGWALYPDGSPCETTFFVKSL